MMAGYSGKPLAEKIGVKVGVEIALLHAPEVARKLPRVA